MTVLSPRSERRIPLPFPQPGITRMAFLRLFDITLSLGLLMLSAPAMALLAARSLLTSGRVLSRRRRLGKGMAIIHCHAFAARGPGRALPVLLDILSGRMGFVGPQSRSACELVGMAPACPERFAVRPGLVSISDVRRRAGIAYALDADAELDEIARLSAGYSVAVLLRFAAASWLGGASAPSTRSHVMLFGVSVANLSMSKAVAWIIERATRGVPTTLCFVNADCFNRATGDADYRAVLQAADCVLADGTGVAIAGKMLGSPFVENVNGTDLFPRLCEAAAATGLGIFLFGAQPGVADIVARKMTARFPGLRIVGTRHGYVSADDESEAVSEINASGADILLVAMGAPRQEKWLARHRDALQPAVRMGVGGLFDFYSERVSRAPLWLRELRMEWVWRLMQEPRRMWRRYLLGNGLFLMRLALHAASIRLSGRP